jgi:molecular chaperone HtpG
MSKHTFKTEVSQLLHLIIHSLYSHKEIFLRELVSNASDALDKLKYLTITDEAYKGIDFEPKVEISFTEDAGKRTITISDNGIGMDKDDLTSQLGTIARSGTKAFLEKLSGDAKKDANLIGQFGVGFYSIFMVADKVEVTTRKAGQDDAWLWKSDGKSNFTVDEAQREEQGTTILLHLNDEGEEYANRWQIEQLVKKYSNHIPFPIFLEYEQKEYDDKGEETGEVEQKREQINSAAALWKRSKSDLTDEDYNEFYKSIGHDSDDPLHYLHTKAEGTIEYTTLFYIPKNAPFDMYQADFKPGIKLYVKRVFITDDEKELMPTYLRFLRGVIDSEDLPLNVSREILQQNRVMTNIRNASVKKVLGEIKSLADNNPEKFADFIKQFNRPMKEGLYSDFTNRETLLEIVRYKSTTEEGYTSLASYKERMKEDQKAIYYITGGDEDTLSSSPLLEAYREKGIEVLIMDDEIDEIVVPTIGKYGDVELKSVNRSGAADELKSDEDKETESSAKPLMERMKKALGERVKDVVASTRLSDSPSCIVADENDPTVQLQQMMKAMGQKDMPDFKPILEVNPKHPIVKSLESSSDDSLVEDVASLLLDQAMLIEGAEIKKPADFVKRLNRIMEKAL